MEGKDIQLGQTITLASGETFKVARIMPGARYDLLEVYPTDGSADLPPYFEVARHDQVTLAEPDSDDRIVVLRVALHVGDSDLTAEQLRALVEKSIPVGWPTVDLA